MVVYHEFKSCIIVINLYVMCPFLVRRKGGVTCTCTCLVKFKVKLAWTQVHQSGRHALSYGQESGLQHRQKSQAHTHALGVK